MRARPRGPSTRARTGAATVVAALVVASVVACEADREVRIPVVYANDSAQDVFIRVTDDGGGPGRGSTGRYRLAAHSRAILADQASFTGEVLSRDCLPIGHIESTGLLGGDPAPAFLRVLVTADLRVSIAPVVGEDTLADAPLERHARCR